MSIFRTNCRRVKLALKLVFIILFVFLSNHSASCYGKPKKINIKHTLIDKTNGNYYVLDKTRTMVSAYNKQNKLLWRTNPFKDSFLPIYRTTRPVIDFFKLTKGKYINRNEEVIWIVFNSSQGGYLLKSNGKFYFLGND